jgi:hypothetical protein
LSKLSAEEFMMNGKKLLTLNLDDKLKILKDGVMKNWEKISFKNEENYDREYKYWTDGQKVYFLGYLIKGADIESFEQYQGGWGKDKNHCYCGATRMQKADAKSFEVLNYTYAKDNFNVWTLGGKIKDADSNTFEVCDNGMYSLGKKWNRETGPEVLYDMLVSQGYGKDKFNVYYFDSDGKANVVKNAYPKTFISLGDGNFGYDEKSVFFGRSKLQKADPNTWKKYKDLYYYSTDKKNVYYTNRIIKGADAETFEVLEQKVILGLPTQLAKDKNHYYWNDTIETKEKVEEFRNNVVRPHFV